MSKWLSWLLIIAPLVTTAISLGLVLSYAPQYTLLQVPFASWFVLFLNGLALALGGAAFLFWRRFVGERARYIQTAQQLAAHALPKVEAHGDSLSSDEMRVIQCLFQDLPDVACVQVAPMAGGYSGSKTMQADLQRKQRVDLWPRSFVIKLGERADTAGERDKFYRHVLPALAWSPHLFREADCQGCAGIAYMFAGLGGDIQNLHEFYAGHAASEIAAVVEQAYSHLEQAWYSAGGKFKVNLYDEYAWLYDQSQKIIERAAALVEPDDPYLGQFEQSEAQPAFCDGRDIALWRDPRLFLRSWPSGALHAWIWRSEVHGDLHSRNILLESEKGQCAPARLWFIDFSHAGNGLSQTRAQELNERGVQVHPDAGHTLRDFCRLETDVKFILTRLQGQQDLERALTFEKELLRCGLALDGPAPDLDEPFGKAWQVVGAIRRRAARYLDVDGSAPRDMRPYYFSLLHATLPVVYYSPEQFCGTECERWQKRYAFASAGMLCGQLTDKSVKR